MSVLSKNCKLKKKKNKVNEIFESPKKIEGKNLRNMRKRFS